MTATTTAATPTAGPAEFEISRGHKVAATAHILRRFATTSAYVAWEKLRPTPPRTSRDVPVSAAEITPEWLTAVLCRQAPGARVLSFEVPGGSAGTSTRHALRLRYNEAGQEARLPTELYTKTTTSLTQRMMLGLAGVIFAEIGFFNEIRPRVAIETPYGYHSALDRRSWRSISLLENIAVTRGATFRHSDHTFTRSEMEDLLEVLATLHGTLWLDPLITRTGRWLRTPADCLVAIKTSINMRKRAAIGARQAEAVMPPALMGRLDDLWFAFERSMAHASEGTLTFLHGDTHPGNTYVTEAGRAGYTDWQMCMRGSWAFDVALTMSSVLAVEDRRAWERELLSLYLEHLAAAGEPPEFEQAWDMYREQILYPYHSWTYTIGTRHPKMQPDHLCLPIIERTAAAIADHGSIELAMQH